MNLLIRLLTIIVILTTLIYIFIYIPYPNSWEQASISQILVIFVSFLIISTLIIDLFLKYLPRSFILGMGLMVMITLQALNILNSLLAIEIILVSILLARIFPKLRLTGSIKIPKLQKIERQKK